MWIFAFPALFVGVLLIGAGALVASAVVMGGAWWVSKRLRQRRRNLR